MRIERGGGIEVEGLWMRGREGRKENLDKQESFQFVEISKDRAGWNLGYEYEYEYEYSAVYCSSYPYRHVQKNKQKNKKKTKKKNATYELPSRRAP